MIVEYRSTSRITAADERRHDIENLFFYIYSKIPLYAFNNYQLTYDVRIC